MARQTNSEHIDLLELFAEDQTLANKIGQFLVPRLFDFLKGRSQAPLLIVSGIEFLKATWSGQSNIGEQFASHVETWDQKLCLLLVLQYDKIIATREYRRFCQYTFVIYICNGFIFATQKSGEEYTEEERAEIFESAVKLIYRCLFLFYGLSRDDFAYILDAFPVLKKKEEKAFGEFIQA